MKYYLKLKRYDDDLNIYTTIIDGKIVYRKKDNV